MKKIVFILFLFGITLCARENPFFPVNNETNTPSYSTNIIQKPEPFKQTTITIPNSARVLQSVTVAFKNIDGSITVKKIPLHKAIDWHDPLIITTKSQLTSKSSSKKQVKKLHYKKIASLRFISFYASYKKLKIVTKDRLLRHFKLVKPDRIVLDFKRNADFRTYSFSKKSKIFQKIVIGNHDGYYRVVVTLDGKYLYKISKKSGYYLIELH